MKVAILILAHKNLEQINRLAHLFSSERFIVFIHFDSKMNIGSFKPESNIIVLNKRYDCSLDSKELVLAELELLKCASKYNCFYYCLISGEDYPIIHPDSLYEYLRFHGKSIIDITPYGLNWVAFKYIASDYYKITSKKHKLFGAFSKMLVLLVDIVFIQKFNTLRHRLKKNGVKRLYGGSQWWCLNSSDAKKILGFNRRSVINLLLESYTPEETFFQSLLMHIGFDNLNINKKYTKLRNSLTFIDFGNGEFGKKRKITNHPYYLGMDDIPALSKAAKHDYYFARKFKYNDPVLNVIDDMIGVFK